MRPKGKERKGKRGSKTENHTCSPDIQKRTRKGKKGPFRKRRMEHRKSRRNEVRESNLCLCVQLIDICSVFPFLPFLPSLLSLSFVLVLFNPGPDISTFTFLFPFSVPRIHHQSLTHTVPSFPTRPSQSLHPSIPPSIALFPPFLDAVDNNDIVQHTLTHSLSYTQTA